MGPELEAVDEADPPPQAVSMATSAAVTTTMAVLLEPSIARMGMSILILPR
jgi:hypothetical protein